MVVCVMLAIGVPEITKRFVPEFVVVSPLIAKELDPVQLKANPVAPLVSHRQCLVLGYHHK